MSAPNRLALSRIVAERQLERRLQRRPPKAPMTAEMNFLRLAAVSAMVAPAKPIRHLPGTAPKSAKFREFCSLRT